METETIVTWIALVVSGVIGFGTLVHFFFLMNHWLNAKGEVIGNYASSAGSSTSSDSTAYFAIVKFIAADGREYEIRGDIGRRKRWPLGEEVIVSYAPDDPSKTMTMNAAQKLVFSGAFIACFAACVYVLKTGAV